jgi:hypothetical protein
MTDQDDEAPQRYAAMRADYEEGSTTVNAVALKHGVSLGALRMRARRNKWTRPEAESFDRRLLIQRLLGLLERQIERMEHEMNSGNAVEAKVLGDMVRNLDRLIVLEKAHGSGADDGQSKEMRDLQAKLARRINAITKA